MRALWRRHGLTGVGVEEDGIERLAGEATGLKLERRFDDWLRSARELPLKALLATHGVEMELRAAESAQDKGGKPAGSKTLPGSRCSAFARERKAMTPPSRTCSKAARRRRRESLPATCWSRWRV